MARNVRGAPRGGVRAVPIDRRKHKVSLSIFGKVCRRGESFRAFFNSLPRVLAADDLRRCRDAIVRARQRGRPVILCMGGHVVKCGLNRILIDLMQRRVITALAMNGAASIHDFEIALAGHTSEDVQQGLDDGTFGMTRETGEMMNEALALGAAEGLGAGWAIGRSILEHKLPHRDASILAQAVRRRMPATVHIAIGTDIIHEHPQADGAVIGKTTMDDFRIFTEIVADLSGGVILNAGSAVIMPEVFLKALTVARSRGRVVRDFTTVAFDMIMHYRPLQNVVIRPVAAGGRGYYLIGHHEIMLPLLARAILEEL